MSCTDEPGPVAIRGFILQTTGGVLTVDMMHAAREKAGETEQHPKTAADPEKIVAAIKVMLNDLRIHVDSPDAADLITRIETGEIHLTNAYAEALRTLGARVADAERAAGREQCDTCAQFVSPTDPDHPCTPALVTARRVIRESDRTDIHRPSSPDFDPQAYDFYGVYASSARYAGYTSPRIRQQVVSDLIDQGYRIGHGSSSQCGHCGRAIMYGALMAREDVKEFIFIGEDCLDRRFDLTKDEFQELRKTASLNRFREKLSDRREAFLAAHPDLIGIKDADHHTLIDMSHYLDRNGELTEKQVELARKIIKREAAKKARLAERDAERVRLLNAGVKAPSGKVDGITGEVVHVKVEEGYYGTHLTYTYKMLVKTTEGWMVWSTVPARGIRNDPMFDGKDITHELVGKTVQFTAELTPKDTDPLFAFAKGPSKAKIVS